MKNKKPFYLLAVLVIVITLFFVSRHSNTQTSPKSSHQSTAFSISAIPSPSPTGAIQELIPVNKIIDAYTIHVDNANPSNTYIATRHGLLLLKNDSNLYRVGDNKNDITGFSINPVNPQILFSSGRSESGGNTGFQQSDDGGFTWKKISDGVNGPVAFRAIAVSPVNPRIIYGWYQESLQKSTDTGTTWNIVSKTPFSVTALAADTQDENKVYATSPQGLFVSKDAGKNWNRLIEGSVSLVSIDSRNNNNLYSYSEKFALADSSNGGAEWHTTNANFNGQPPLYLGYYQKGQQDIVYILTEEDSIYKSINGGGGWSKVY